MLEGLVCLHIETRLFIDFTSHFAFCGIRCGTIVSGDSSGSVQFWDGLFGTLLQAHSCHKGDVNALAAAPSHNRVFSAGSDGQVYSHSSFFLGVFMPALLFRQISTLYHGWSSSYQPLPLP